LNFVKNHPTQCYMRETNDKLTMTFPGVNSVNKALAAIGEME